jgi:hypothetical protein
LNSSLRGLFWHKDGGTRELTLAQVPGTGSAIYLQLSSAEG